MSEEKLEGDPGYTEADIEQAAGDSRLITAAWRYANDRLTLGEAIDAYDPARQTWISTEFQYVPRAYHRLVHEIAMRLHNGAILPPSQTESGCQDIYAKRTEWDGESQRRSSSNFLFSELETEELKRRFITPERDGYSEADIAFFTASPFAVGCFDAYGQEIIALWDFYYRVFGDAYAPLPRNLSPQGFAGMAREIVSRIKEGRIETAGLREQFPSAYAPADHNFYV